MKKQSKYTCIVCGEEEYGKAPYCKCEREYDKTQKEITRNVLTGINKILNKEKK